MAVVAAFLSLGVLPSDAEAKRMGSGGSFGRSAPSQFQKSPPASPSGAASTAPSKQQATNGTAAGNTAAAAPRNRFLGPLAGLAAGLGLAALFSHLGMGAGLAEFMGTLLMVGALVFAVVFLVRMLRGQKGNKPQPAYNAQGASGSAYGNNSYRQAPEAMTIIQLFSGGARALKSVWGTLFLSCRPRPPSGRPSRSSPP